MSVAAGMMEAQCGRLNCESPKGATSWPGICHRQAEFKDVVKLRSSGGKMTGLSGWA